MNSEWIINEWLLRDPSLVDKAFDLGLTYEMFAQDETRSIFHLIVTSWYDFKQRPTAKSLLKAGYSGFEEYEPTKSLVEAVTYVSNRYKLRRLKEQLINGQVRI